MRATQHPSNNRVIGAPQGWEQGELPCSALAVTDSHVAGRRVVASFWRPTAEDLATLNAGGLISLWVVGDMHPLVAIEVEPAM